ncbi:hypothetical protein SynRCC2555_00059 [Synechococcus sp. WH 8101]|nr:hypothetical protein SynRCC2555_00059 [Synechococcus sp. WH 8101]
MVSLIQGRGAGDLLREDLFATCFLQFLDLSIQTLLLVGRGCPCVTDFPSHLFGKSEPF